MAIIKHCTMNCSGGVPAGGCDDCMTEYTTIQREAIREKYPDAEFNAWLDRPENARWAQWGNMLKVDALWIGFAAGRGYK